ncbi:MAG: YlmC/YmxH family sporulation protein [Selenomonadales bacterium]|nr:YlmC/YmxH family sporulation protein [Selenomonadales bacterium]MBQ2246589.1 YlmC/YmxH family sporulation protein [Selenomonadales bacterium]
MITIRELRRKDVIGVADGKRIGRVTDIVFDEETGQVTTLVIGVRRPWFGLLESEEKRTVSYDMVRTMGRDVILIDEDDLVKRSE